MKTSSKLENYRRETPHQLTTPISALLNCPSAVTRKLYENFLVVGGGLWPDRNEPPPFSVPRPQTLLPRPPQTWTFAVTPHSGPSVPTPWSFSGSAGRARLSRNNAPTPLAPPCPSVGSLVADCPLGRLSASPRASAPVQRRGTRDGEILGKGMHPDLWVFGPRRQTGGRN